MASSTWPSSLPDKALAAGYSESAPETVIRTPMDAGPAKVRRRCTGGVRRITVRQILTAAQVATLDIFFVEDLAGGSLAFDWVHPRTQAEVEMRFLSAPKYGEPKGNYWPVSFELEILP